MKRSYSDDEKSSALAALDASGGNVAGTARKLGVPRKTLEEWSRGRVHPSVAEIRREKRSGLADRLEDLAHQLVDAIPGKLDAAPLQQISVSLGIALEKMRLLREQPTSIDSHELSDDERLARLDALYERVRSRGAGSPPASNGPA